MKPESPNQDSWCVAQATENVWIYGVFDGHGKQGHDVSDVVAAMLPRLLIEKLGDGENVKQSLQDAFEATNQLILTATMGSRMDAWEAGTTATVVVHDRTLRRITVAHVGDSGACLVCGGSIVFDGYFNYRVFADGKDYPGLNMSRALGDVKGQLEAGITAEPTVFELDLDDMDTHLALCSDGVWEFMTSADVADYLSERKALPLSETANALSRESQERWLQEEGDVVDDITAILVCL